MAYNRLPATGYRLHGHILYMPHFTLSKVYLAVLAVLAVLADIQVADIQVADIQVADIQVAVLADDHLAVLAGHRASKMLQRSIGGGRAERQRHRSG